MEHSPVKVFIIDNHPTFRYGLRQILNENLGNVLTNEFSGFDAFESAKSERPDLVIAGVNDDAQMLAFRKLSNTKFGELKILLLYADDQHNHILRYLAHSLIDIISKSTDITRIIEIVTSILADCRQRSRHLLTSKLSDRENEIAYYLSKGLRTSDISDLMNLKPSTISTVKNRIFSKTHTSNIIELRELLRS